jgi:nucleoside-triphosphatase THEP1
MDDHARSVDASEEDAIPDLKTTLKVIEKAFVPLPSISRDSTLFDFLYCRRDKERIDLRRMLTEDCKLGINVVLTGDPGVGKTTFLHDVLVRDDYAADHGLCVICINCRKYEGMALEQKLPLLKKDFVAGLSDYFAAVGQPFNMAKLDEPWTDGLLVDAKDHLANVITKELQVNKCFPIVVIDDVDYMEVELQHTLLCILSDIISSDRISIIYTCREPALKEISYHLSDRPRYQFSEHSKTLRLEPLSPREVLARRLAITLRVNESKSTIRNLLEGLSMTDRRDAFEKYLAQQGASLKKAESITYPFTDNQEHYMGELSNGDIRVVFQIAARLLSFTLDEENKDKWTPMDDGTRYIGRENLLNILSDFRGAHYQNPHVPVHYSELYRLIDIHEMKSQVKGNARQSGNSLIENLLETLINERDIHPEARLWTTMAELGHTKYETRIGLDFCDEARLIKPVMITTCGPPGSRRTPESELYTLTRKGVFYIKDMRHWKEYKKRFGSGRLSAYDVEGGLARLRLYEDILEMVCALVYLSEGNSKYLKVDKSAFMDLFLRKYGPGYVERFDEPVKESRSTLTQRDLDRELILPGNKGIASSYKEGRRSYYAIKKGQARIQAGRRGIAHAGNQPVFPSHKFREEEVREFLDKFCDEEATAGLGRNGS